VIGWPATPKISAQRVVQSSVELAATSKGWWVHKDSNLGPAN